MAKVITFSRVFPAYHPRKGQSTNFVEKFWKSIGYSNIADGLEREYSNWFNGEFLPKHHTIRSGHRFKQGEYFSPRVWSASPYNYKRDGSKHIIIAEDVLVVSTFNFELTGSEYLLNGRSLNLTELKQVAMNDGLEVDDLELWFQKPFKGQVICWNKSVNY